MPFDILDDSVLDIAQGIVHKAYGGKQFAPVGGLDAPSSCILSRCDKEVSDLHLEFDTEGEPYGLSAVEGASSVHYAHDPGPNDTTDPFIGSIGDRAAPGPFGKALNAAGKICALLIEHGIDHIPYMAAFKADWGVPPDIDLTPAIPRLRSTGPAMWGGIGRALTVGLLGAIPAASKVRVVFHNRNRAAFGHGKLLDWPRLTTIARAIGASLISEDTVAKGKVKRLDFRVVTREVPTAPEGVGLDTTRIPREYVYEAGTAHHPALRYMEQVAARHKAQLKAHGTAAVEGEMPPTMPTSVLAKTLEIRTALRVPRISLLDMRDDDTYIDIAETRHAPSREAAREAFGATDDMFEAVITPFVEKYLHSFPLAQDMRNLAGTTVNAFGAEATAARNRLCDLIWMQLPDTVLLRYHRFVSFATHDSDQGWDEYVKLLRVMDVPPSFYQQRDLQAAWVGARTVASAVAYVGRRVANVVARLRTAHGTGLVMTTKLNRLLSEGASVGDILNHIVTRRRNYWSMRYKVRSAEVSEVTERVQLQLVSKLMRLARIRITSYTEAVHDENNQEQKSGLYESYLNYMRKRRARGLTYMPAAMPQVDSLQALAKELDARAHSPVTYSSAVERYKVCVAYLVQDVRDYLRKIANARTYDEADNNQELIEDDEIDRLLALDEDILAAPDVESIENWRQDTARVVEPVVEPEEFMLDDDDLAEIGNTVVDPTVDVLDDLEEDFPNVCFSENMLSRIVARFGERVHINQLPEVHQYVRAMVAEASGVTALGGGYVGMPDAGTFVDIE